VNRDSLSTFGIEASVNVARESRPGTPQLESESKANSRWTRRRNKFEVPDNPSWIFQAYARRATKQAGEHRVRSFAELGSGADEIPNGIHALQRGGIACRN
jgi:hypothetical protein